MYGGVWLEVQVILCTHKLHWNFEADLFVLLFHQWPTGCVSASLGGFLSFQAHLHYTGKVLTYSDILVYVFNKSSQRLKQKFMFSLLGFYFFFLLFTASLVSLLFREIVPFHIGYFWIHSQWEAVKVTKAA